MTSLHHHALDDSNGSNAIKEIRKSVLCMSIEFQETITVGSHFPYESDRCHHPFPIMHIAAADRDQQRSGDSSLVAQYLHSLPSSPTPFSQTSSSILHKMTDITYITEASKRPMHLQNPVASMQLEYESYEPDMSRGRTILLIDVTLPTEGALCYPLENHAQVDTVPNGIGLLIIPSTPAIPNDYRCVGSRERGVHCFR